MVAAGVASVSSAFFFSHGSSFVITGEPPASLMDSALASGDFSFWS